MVFKRLAAIFAVTFFTTAVSSCFAEDKTPDSNPTDNSTNQSLETKFDSRNIGDWDDICEVTQIDKLDPLYPSDFDNDEPEFEITDEEFARCSAVGMDGFSIFVTLYGARYSDDAHKNYESRVESMDHTAAERSSNSYTVEFDSDWDESAMTVQPDEDREEGVWISARYDSVLLYLSIPYMYPDEKCPAGTPVDEAECIPNAAEVGEWVQENYIPFLLENVKARLEQDLSFPVMGFWGRSSQCEWEGAKYLLRKLAEF